MKDVVSVGIANGERVSVTLGRRYLVRTIGQASPTEVVIGARRRNGDLRIVDDLSESGGSFLRPRTIDSLVVVPDDIDEVESDAGQAALEAAHKAAQAARNGRPKLTKLGREKLIAAGADPVEVSTATSAEDVVTVKTKGTPYSERNQVWRCGTCGRRTRKASCENGHPPVVAPIGKRKEDRP